MLELSPTTATTVTYDYCRYLLLLPLPTIYCCSRYPLLPTAATYVFLLLLPTTYRHYLSTANAAAYCHCQLPLPTDTAAYCYLRLPSCARFSNSYFL